MSPIFLLAATGILVRAYINGWLYGEWRWW